APGRGPLGARPLRRLADRAPRDARGRGAAPPERGGRRELDAAATATRTTSAGASASARVESEEIAGPAVAGTTKRSTGERFEDLQVRCRRAPASVALAHMVWRA